MSELDLNTTNRLLALRSLQKQAGREYDARVQTQVQDLVMQVAARRCGIAIEARRLARFDWYGQAWAMREIGHILHPRLDIGESVPLLTKVAGAWMIQTDYGQTVVLVWQDCGEWSGYDQRVVPLEIVDIPLGDKPAAVAAILLHLSSRPEGL